MVSTGGALANTIIESIAQSLGRFLSFPMVYDMPMSLRGNMHAQAADCHTDLEQSLHVCFWRENEKTRDRV